MEKKLVRHSLKIGWGKTGDLEAGRQLLAVAWVRILTLPFTSWGSWSKLISLHVNFLLWLQQYIHTSQGSFIYQIFIRHLLCILGNSALDKTKFTLHKTFIQWGLFWGLNLLIRKKHLEEHLAHSECPPLALPLSSCGASRRSHDTWASEVSSQVLRSSVVLWNLILHLDVGLLPISSENNIASAFPCPDRGHKPAPETSRGWK